MIWGIHYFTTKLKTKIDVIPRGCFKNQLIKKLWPKDVRTTSQGFIYLTLLTLEQLN